MVNLFVWDFHGVLEKDNEYAVREVSELVLREFGSKRPVTVQECLDLYGKKWGQYFRHFAPEADQETIHQMVDRSVEIGLKGDIIRKHIKPNDYAHQVLKTISQKSHKNLVMSNSTPESLDLFLDAVGMSETFDYKHGADHHRKNAHEKNSKEVWLRQFIQDNRFKYLIVIDDAVMGIEMGRNVGAVTYLFSRKGFDKSIKADYYISDLREVLKEI